ncbi:MetQ/NlpA family ABC transporter substrate-binding protein [Cohnella terricola]|uniref:Lipoprotein n=1 Tax=Cohnella terricola TaxID=1289167 RepID=A0A559JWH3_9BACL|nr:MetQ/NlpA family ABC transporter substrate-binding protein [Cohnella terricola]TVY04242.1 MetQ/NlpA family ABC transporter substrate-binding protein [Cohnella terricola]
MKIRLWVSAFLVLAIFLAGCSNKKDGDATVVKIGVVGEPQKVIWDAVKKNLAADGDKIELSFISFTDGIIANQALKDKELDFTLFQHYAFLNQEIADKGYDFAVIGEALVAPLSVYSKKITDINQIKDGDSIAIPNNTTNAGRALKVLERAGLIEVDASKGYLPTVQDITANKHNLKIKEVDPALIPSLLPDLAAGITNAGIAIDNGLSPITDAIFSIPVDPNDDNIKPYINIFVARAADKDNETYSKIVKAYRQDNVAKAMLDEYKGALVPAWNYTK